jgi:hypothetical protein
MIPVPVTLGTQPLPPVITRSTAMSRPAAYLRLTDPAGRQAVIEVARQSGWPDPGLYTETPQDAPGARAALDRLIDSVATGQHHAVLIPGQPADARLKRLFRACADHGVPVVTAFPRPRPAGPGPGTPTLAELLASSRLSR